MPRPDAIDRLIRHVTETDSAAIPPEARAAARTFILDTLGVAIAGTTGPHVEDLAACAAGWGSGPEAGVWGSPRRLPAPHAAMLNAYQAHNSEFDAIHEPAVVHPLASILGALLAVAERRGGLDGETFLASVVLGVDVSCSIGMAATTTLRFFRPATAGAFGALAALGRAAGFDATTHEAAFGCLLGQIGGTMQAHLEGSPLLGMQLGFCTRAAVMAHDMAAHGIAGPRDVLEGPYGYFALFEGGADIERGFAALGETWRIAQLSHKPFPSGRATHGVVDGLLTLRAEHGFAAGDVAAVEAVVPPLVHQLTGRPVVDGLGVNYARLCIPYVGAVALAEGTVGVDDFRPERLSDPTLHALARRIAVTVENRGDPNALVPQRVSVRLHDGRRFETALPTVLGSPAKPLSRERHLAKFRRNWQSAARSLDPARGEALIALIDRLERVPDCREIVDLMRPAG